MLRDLAALREAPCVRLIGWHATESSSHFGGGNLEVFERSEDTEHG